MQFLVPAGAVVLGAVFLAEPVGLPQVVGGAVIVLGVWLTRRPSILPPARARAAILGRVTGRLDPVTLGAARSAAVVRAAAGPRRRRWRPGQPPLAILVDYDGTIARTDVSDTLMAEFVTADWESHVAEYDAGLVGLAAADGLGGRADHAPIPTRCGRRRPPSRTTRRSARSRSGRSRPGSRSRWCRTGSASSSSPPSRRWASAGCRSSPPRRRSAPDGARIEFPNGNPDCFVCGTCKRNRVLAHQAAGRAVAFIGDGPSDRYAAGYSDVVFAKESLEQICIAEGWAYPRWTDFTRDRRLAGPDASRRSRPTRRPCAGPRHRPLVLRRGGLPSSDPASRTPAGRFPETN